MAEPSTAAVSHPVRLLLIAVFLPAFPLCIAHGVVSSHPAPAAGLVPLAASALSAALLLRLRPRSGAESDDDDDGHPAPRTPTDDNEDDDAAARRRRVVASLRRNLSHPVAVFAYDTVLAAALMIVLVFTWIAPGRSASLGMLAAYATIPLLTGFFVHLLLAVSAFYHGLALHGLFQWAAWRAVPPDCPNCDSRLRPALPEFPWLRRFRRGGRGGGPGSGGDYAPVFVEESARYRDDPDGGEARAPQPEAVEVRRKERKGKGTPAPSEEATPWGT